MLSDSPTLSLQSRRPSESRRSFRLEHILFVVVLSDLVLVVANVLSYQPFLQQTGSFLYIMEPVVLLLVYVGVLSVLTWRPDTERRSLLRMGTQVGVVAALFWVISLAIETFANLHGLANILSTAPFLLGGFALWCFTGYRGARETDSLKSGVLAAIWAGMTTVLLTIAFGFLLGLVALPRLAQQITGSPEQIVSGWQDSQAFAIANQFDASFQHLLGALVIGGIVGTLGAFIGIGRRPEQPSPANS